jgi:hypothetical protein
MNAIINNNLHQLWLKQLVSEFENICYLYRIQLKTPIFELSEAKQQFGCWLAGQRTVRISRHLIAQHPWDTVLMVLKHEMAHQLCSEYFNLKNAGHGKDFQRACQLLGVPSPYNRSSGDLPQVLADPVTNQQTAAGRKIIGRIEKLLSLAGSDNEHEAALAMRRATELLNRHNLEMAAVENPSACMHRLINTGKKQIPSWRRAICGILQEYFFVKIVFSSLYDAQNNTSYKTVTLLGRSDNVPVAEHCYHFLEQQLDSLWRTNRHAFTGSTGNTITVKNSYYLGLLHGFSQKLAEQTKKTRPMAPQTYHGSVSALVVSEDRALQDFIGSHFARLRSRSARSVPIYADSYNKAVVQGGSIVLHRSVTEKKNGVRGLLD